MYTNLNVTRLEHAPLENSPSALTTMPYVLIKVRRNSYTFFICFERNIYSLSSEKC